MAEELVLNIDYDISAAEMKQKKLDAEFEKAKQKAAETGSEVENLTTQLAQQEKELKRINSEYQKKLAYVQDINTQLANATDLGEQTRLQEIRDREIVKLGTLAGKQTEYTNKVAETQALLEKANTAHDKANEKLTNIVIKEKQVAEKAQAASAAQATMPPALERASRSLDKFTNRIKGLIKRVFIFSLITMALRKLRKAIGEMLGKDSDLQQYISQIKGNLAVMGRTLFETLKPVIEWLLQKIAYLTQLLAVILAKVLKKDVKQMADMAKSSAKTAKNAEKATAAFDTLQKIDTSSKDSDSSAGADFSQFDGAAWTDEQLAKIMAVAGTALLAIGLILVFSGANIPLGLAAMAAGIVMLVTAIKMSNTMEQNVKSFIGKVMAIAGAALLVLGIILCVAGVSLPLGIAAIVAGVALIVGAVALNWELIKEKLNEWKGKIMVIVATMALIIGIILLITGVNIPLGLGLILLGASLWAASPQEEKDWVLQKIQDAKEAIGKAWNWFVEKFNWLKDRIGEIASNIWANLKNGFWSFVNFIIRGVNWIVDKINALLTGINGINILGFSPNIPLIPHIPEIQVPKLAKGAVIAGGSPFLAMLGDQRKGQTNIETPLETMIEAFKAAQQETNVNIEFTGTLAQLARVLNPQIKKNKGGRQYGNDRRNSPQMRVGEEILETNSRHYQRRQFGAFAGHEINVP